jgi:hypothetical protein
MTSKIFNELCIQCTRLYCFGCAVNKMRINVNGQNKIGSVVPDHSIRNLPKTFDQVHELLVLLRASGRMS